ncbi:MAG: hypothetical protein WC519_01205 [Parcubacteria group bacterium]
MLKKLITIAVIIAIVTSLIPACADVTSNKSAKYVPVTVYEYLGYTVTRQLGATYVEEPGKPVYVIPESEHIKIDGWPYIPIEDISTIEGVSWNLNEKGNYEITRWLDSSATDKSLELKETSYSDMLGESIGVSLYAVQGSEGKGDSPTVKIVLEIGVAYK